MSRPAPSDGWVSNLAAALGRGWAVMVEVSTPRSAGQQRLIRAIRTVSPLVDALAFPGNPGANCAHGFDRGLRAGLAGGEPIWPAAAIRTPMRSSGPLK